jgi:hypothetical protein
LCFLALFSVGWRKSRFKLIPTFNLELSSPPLSSPSSTGFVSGGFITILPLATAHRFGPQTLATVLGMLNLAWAPGFLFGSPLAGAIIDAHTVRDAQGNVLYQDWWPVQVYGGCLFGACAALALWERLRENKSLLKKC